MSGIQYSVDIYDILNIKTTLVLMSMGTKIKKIFPLRITTVTTARQHVNLSYITASKTSHYVLLKDLSRLVLRQDNNDNNKRYFCQFCLHDCISEEVLKNHSGRCKLHGA